MRQLVYFNSFIFICQELFKVFSNSFFMSYCSLTACLLYHKFNALSRTFFIFFNFFLQLSTEMSKKIRLIQKRINHIIVLSLRQVLFYIFLHFSVSFSGCIEYIHKYLYQHIFIIQIIQDIIFPDQRQSLLTYLCVA